MASTININIGPLWTLVADAGFIAASAMHPSEIAEWVISDSGAPSESLTGHPVPRDASLGMTLEGSEQLFLRNTGTGLMTAAVTVA